MQKEKIQAKDKATRLAGREAMKGNNFNEGPIASKTMRYIQQFRHEIDRKQKAASPEKDYVEKGPISEKRQKYEDVKQRTWTSAIWRGIVLEPQGVYI